jgi:hypothetical protein
MGEFMIQPVAPQAACSTPFPFDRVRRCAIHPAVGIVRVGNSPGESFIGPETPPDPQKIEVPEGGFKDSQGRIKRQGARFRIYAYDDKGENLGELPIWSKNSPDAATTAQVTWTVHLANSKGAWYKVHPRSARPAGVRNADVPVVPGMPPDTRESLMIDPGERRIKGEASLWQSGESAVLFDTGSFRGTKVPLGELKVDDDGRLIVLGGFGKSGSTKPGNPIGADETKCDYWANNDYWYDDISDGPVTAVVELPGDRKLDVGDPRDASWVVVAPPKYAPGVYPVVTLYDVVRDVAVSQGWIADAPRVTYWDDIYPVLRRAADTAWVSDEARRGHGFDKRGDFTMARGGLQPGATKTRVTRACADSRELAEPDKNAPARQRIFARLRNADATASDALTQADYSFMPPLSGDDGDRTRGEVGTWLTLLPSQYRKFERWKDGDYDSGCPPTYPALGAMCSPQLETYALQKAALEPCVGGAFYPGVEVPWIAADPRLYVDAFRIDSTRYKAGDITKGMCVPWQADFHECRDGWWPAARPDDVIPEEVFAEANKAWQRGQPQVQEGLESRVKWDRGLGVSTLFRRPWQNPAEALDDPRDRARRGCDDMVRYWWELGFVVPLKTAWQGAPGESEYVHVEVERRPHAGMDVRELFQCLLNIEENISCLSKVEEYVLAVLTAARELQETASAFAWMDNIRPFRYDEDVFETRMDDIYDDCVDFAFTETIDGARVKFDPTDPEQNPYFRTREAVTERIRQLTPFNFVDGSWLRNIHHIGPVDEVNAILFRILKEELGEGIVALNHANIYRDLCHSFGFYPPPIQSTVFAYDPAFLDCAFDSPTFQLGISQFSRRFYPEIMGMSLWLEWTAIDLHRIAAIAENVKLDSYFYRMHITIDNRAEGHGAGILKAVKMYLQQVRNQGGEQAVQCHWQRIWDGYVAFSYTFVVVVRQVMRIVQEPMTLQGRLRRMIRQKASAGQQNHRRIVFGGRSINERFNDPDEFLKALVEFGYILPGRPNQSKFFKALEPDGRMYRVFTDEEIKLWRDWTLKLPHLSDDPEKQTLAELRERLEVIDRVLAAAIADYTLKSWLRAAKPHRIKLWFEIAVSAQKRRQPQGAQIDIYEAKEYMQKRFRSWLGWAMIRAVTFIAAEHRGVVRGVTLMLIDCATAKRKTIPEWFEEIAAAANAAPLARDMLRSLQEELMESNDLLEQHFGVGTALAYAFDSGIPGNDGKRARAMMEAWVASLCPLPDDEELPRGRVKAFQLESSLNEEEHHPTGIAMGFGTSH